MNTNTLGKRSFAQAKEIIPTGKLEGIGETAVHQPLNHLNSCRLKTDETALKSLLNSGRETNAGSKEQGERDEGQDEQLVSLKYAAQNIQSLRK